MVTADWFWAAAIAPLTLWVLWRVQALAVDQVLRRALYKLLRHLRPLYSVVSWLGTFIHEASHAIVLVVSGHGMKDFTVRTDGGHVRPRRMRKGPAAFIGFLAAALAPIYVPPAILFGLLWWLQPDVVAWVDGGVGGRAALDVAQAVLVTFPLELGRAVLAIDVTRWQDAVLSVLLLIALPSSRPSFVKGSRFHGDEGDIAVVRKMIRKRPWPLFVFFLAVFASYFFVAVWPVWYWRVWQVIWSVAITGIVFAALAALWWLMVAWSSRARWWAGLVPYILLVAWQVVGRDLGVDLVVMNVVSVVGLAVAAAGARWLAPRGF